MIQVAVTGCGYWGPNLIRNFYEDDRVQVKYVCDRVQDRLDKVARRFPASKYTQDYQELLDDPELDAIVVATPVNTHFKLAMAALKAGKHVLIEKPMCASSAEGEQLNEVARQMNRVLMVDHTFIYHPAVHRMKAVMDSGDMGDPLYFNSTRVNLGLFQSDVNVIWDLALHDLSIMDYVLARSPHTVIAAGACHAGNDISDIAYITLLFDNNLIANVHVSWLSPVKLRSVTVGCRNKMMVFNDLVTAEKLRVYDKGITLEQPKTDEERRDVLIKYRVGEMHAPVVDPIEPLHLMSQHFIDCIAEGRTPITDGEAGLRIVRLLERADAAAKTGLPQR